MTKAGTGARPEGEKAEPGAGEKARLTEHRWGDSFVANSRPWQEGARLCAGNEFKMYNSC